MANFEQILRHRPHYAEFIFTKTFRHRGEVLGFPPNYQGKSFTTDERGYRHTVFNGQTMSVAEIVRGGRYGIVLGTSRAFASGVAGNHNTIPSLLSERFGFPFANVSLPHASTRNLFSLLYPMMMRPRSRPAAVVQFTTGDLTGLCYTSHADPIFGSPNPKQLKTIEEGPTVLVEPERALEDMLSFTSLWTRAIADLCRRAGVPMVIPHDTSFFEKRHPSDREIECELGKPVYRYERRWFSNHKKFAERFHNRRAGLAERLKVPLAGPGATNDLGFIDEFHYDEDGTKAMASYIGDALEPLLNR